MQRVLGSLVFGLSLLTMGRVATADPESGTAPPLPAVSSTELAHAGSSDSELSRPESAPITPASKAVATAELGSTENTSSDHGPCSANLLEQYARRKAFTLHLIEQREQQQFEAELAAYEQRREFTQRLTQQRAQLSEAAREQFDAEVERVTRLREVTLRLQDERDLRDALAFAEDLALQERKRAFTRRLVQERAQRAQEAPAATEMSTTAVPK